jgi:hypothetical protein
MLSWNKIENEENRISQIQLNSNKDINLASQNNISKLKRNALSNGELVLSL